MMWVVLRCLDIEAELCAQQNAPWERERGKKNPTLHAQVITTAFGRENKNPCTYVTVTRENKSKCTQVSVYPGN